MSHLEAIEDDIVAKLTADITDVHVQSYPSNPNNYQLIHPNGALLVRYLGSNYTEPDPNSKKVLVQDRVHEWEITVLDKNLRLTKAHQGVYGRIEQVRESLSGYTISTLPDATILFPIRDDFIGTQGGRWQYEIVFGFIEPASEV